MIAVLIPCYNEAMTIEKVIYDFKQELGDSCIIYVYDNNSTDDTAFLARQAGAIVKRANIQGKGATVRQMLSEIEADIYLLVDGDDTYDAGYANDMIAKVSSGYDMVIGDRLSTNYHLVNTRKFHTFGNNLVRRMILRCYRETVTDVMTGYRAFNRAFAKDVIIQHDGFELETEFTIYAIKHKLKVASIPILYRERQKGSMSKVHTFRDGIKILNMIRGDAIC